MKLIRLVSSDSGGLAVFDNHFNSIINIKPKSKIALDTCVLDITQKLIKIRSGVNDEVRYQISSVGGEHGDQRSLSIQNYNTNNIDLFLQDIENKLNANLMYLLPGGGFEQKTLGLEWFVDRYSAINDGKLVIGYNIAPFQDYMGDDFTTDFTEPTDFWYGGTNTAFLEKETIANSHYYSISKKATSDPDTVFSIRSLVEWSRGGANFRVGRMLLADNANPDITKNGFTMRIEDEDGQWVFGVRINRKNSPYQVSPDGITFTDVDDENGDPCNVLNAGGVADQTGDVVEIVVDEQDINLVIYRENKTPVVVDSGKNYNYSSSYKGVISFIGAKANCSISQINYSISLRSFDDRSDYPNGTANLPSVSNYLDVHTRLTNTTPPHPIFKESLNNFYLPADVMKFLGFGQLRYPPSGNSSIDYPRYVANQPLLLGALSDNFIVQLNNIQLKSYDGDTLQDNGQRRSILSLIPDDDSDNQTLYNANERLFLDIDNLQDLNLNRISVSILDDNYEVVRLNNKSSLSVIIKDENE
tara:strand:- start:408 stop:1994 length:1587 start_codon:yes stop_codon:yes gene_type:complete